MWAFVQAPFLHIHVEDSDHPAASPTHSHAPSCHEWQVPTFATHSADDDAIALEWRIAPPQIAFVTFDLPVLGAVIIEPPSVISIAADVPQPRGHDPPEIGPTNPRPPPA